MTKPRVSLHGRASPGDEVPRPATTPAGRRIATKRPGEGSDSPGLFHGFAAERARRGKRRGESCST
ncbi:MAG: hypothetical protein H0V75_17210 [Rubrobacter sp.]|nr:hypothetical protein [Rubrobacter sp.]